MAWWRSNLALVAVVGGMAMSTVACGGAHGQPTQPMGHVEVQRLESPEDAPEAAKTVQVSYIFDRDAVNKDFEKVFTDQFDRKGVHVDEQLDAKAHFDLKAVKITGTVTYVKKKLGYSIIEADLVTEGHYDADVQVDLDVRVKAETAKAPPAAQGAPKKKGMFSAFTRGGAKEGLIPSAAKLEESDFEGTALGGKPFTIVKNVMPTNIPIVGPLFLHAHFDLTAACDIGVEGQMHATTGVGIKGDVRLSAKYKKAGIEKADGKKSKFAFEAKTPNFELAPAPYLKVEGKQQSIKGRCSLQPTAVLLLEHSVGAKLMVEPWVELDASRPNSRTPWKLGTQAGVSVNAATDIEIFGRQIRKPKEFTLFEIALTKPAGDPNAAPPPSPAVAPPAPPAPPANAVAVLKTDEPKKEEPTNALAKNEPEPPAAKASMPAGLKLPTDKPDEKNDSKPAAPADVAAIMASATSDSTDPPATRDDSDANTSTAPKKKLPRRKLANISATGALAGAAARILKKKR